ncbi:MAG: NAD/NADP octopine/nopaline dehydrogenase family protein [Kiritimatiellae bacterium]|nr:NAD/NADP octopine/nopaline dehydrogenase family protein [Kiritimatiellia bacterium]
MNVCVYGGGNIAHSIAAKISQTQPVTVITRRPTNWTRRLSFEQGEKTVESRFDVRATEDARAVSAADLIFVALPQFAIEETLDRILPYLNVGSTVAFVPAPARIVQYVELLKSRGINVVGFQRVPYISRIVEYGRAVKISDNRDVHRIVISSSLTGAWDELCFRWFGGRVEYLSSFLTLAFSNSNPLLHPSRLVVLFKDWRHKIFPDNPPFYGEWTDESSELYISADSEMRKVMSRYPIDMQRDYESVLDHYGVKTARELTVKIRSIPPFRTILSPMLQTADGWVPDFSSRYFTEDVQFGLEEMLRFADKAGVSIPTMQALYDGVRKLRA